MENFSASGLKTSGILLENPYESRDEVAAGGIEKQPEA